MGQTKLHFLALDATLCGGLTAGVAAQAPSTSQPAKRGPSSPANTAASAPARVVVNTPPGYVIGTDDLLTVRFWGDAEMSVDVVVRPDGKISLPLLNDVDAIGLTPEQLGASVEKAAAKFIAEPDATVIVREIRSRKVFVIGQVAKPGAIPLNTDMNVLQALATAGGVLEYANKSDIVIIRREAGRDKRLKFNYNEVVRGKNLQQNIQLVPNDTVVVN